jgi:putative colanic acid biosynthesis UDP-glucose lipid carrier transferase
LSGLNSLMKRVEDLVIGTLMLVALFPVMLLIAACIRAETPGPVLFRQARQGFNNNVFTVFKFRSMVHRPEGDAEVRQATRDDKRVTRVGRVLRRTSLDELPQLFNVLRGEMSLVGPRPHAVEHNLYYASLIDDYINRHKVQPGITGWAQVNGLRGETDTLDKMQRRVQYDLAYIERWSVLFDIKIMILTAVTALFDRKAY